MQINFLFLLAGTLFFGVLLCGLIVLVFSARSNVGADVVVGVQKIHNKQTSRLGGLSVYISFSVSSLISYWFGFFDNAENLLYLCFGLLPLVGAGLIEDVTGKVSPMMRLSAAMISALLTAQLLSVAMRPYEILVVSELVKNTFFSLILTALCVASLTNAINMIDGCNGLASGFALITLPFFLLVCLQQEQIYLPSLICLLLVSILGFWLLNWPKGYLFLGDCGAYFIGASLAWVAILTANDLKLVSNSATFLFFVYPAWELVSTIIRRLKQRKQLMQPDSGHLHSRLYKYLVIKFGHRYDPLYINSLTSVIVLVPVFWVNCVTFILIDKNNFDLNLFALIVSGQISSLSLLSELLRRKIKDG